VAISSQSQDLLPVLVQHSLDLISEVHAIEQCVRKLIAVSSIVSIDPHFISRHGLTNLCSDDATQGDLNP
jgi:predicted alpha/beta hydrolase family esterase